MTQSHLRACAACARHVRVSEVSCPFCGVALSDEFRASPAPLPPRARLSRAALFAFGTGTLAIAAACSSTSPGEPAADAGNGDAAQGDGGNTGFPTPLYGGSVHEPDADLQGVDAYGGVPVEEGGNVIVDAAYGGPAVDAGADAGPVDGAKD